LSFYVAEKQDSAFVNWQKQAFVIILLCFINEVYVGPNPSDVCWLKDQPLNSSVDKE
jgi:hypothetical protein